MKYMPAKKKETQSETKTKNLIKQAVVLGSSLVYLTKGVSDDIVKELEKNKIIQGNEGKEVAEKIRTEVKEKGAAMKQNILVQLGKVINDLSEAAKKQEQSEKPKTTAKRKKV